ncbi:hypothetical protein [Olivibacter sitiensis]|uniref:hypothetical protein n=1 Tax=Olivibacter sitiensis TaxID=376470 RepID=UPI0004187D90|nr:hypothetical protein [Olivibacter sitiensis]
MNNRIERALNESITHYAQQEGESQEQFLTALHAVFNADADFMAKVDLLDSAFDDYIAFEELREFAFDLLLMNFFADDAKRLEEDYLDSPEWEQIEEDTLDRGTELLNVLLYLDECRDVDVEPELEDFLKEFLLVDEDEFQDEHRIYEPLIANQLLVDSSFEEIARVASEIDIEEELAPLFYPVVAFFSEPDPNDDTWKSYLSASNEKAKDAAIYSLLVTFSK